MLRCGSFPAFKQVPLSVCLFVCSPEQEQRLEETILVGCHSVSIPSAWSLVLWKEDVVTGQGPPCHTNPFC